MIARRRLCFILCCIALLPGVPRAGEAQEPKRPRAPSGVLPAPSPGQAQQAEVARSEDSFDPLTTSWSILLTFQAYPELVTEALLTSFTLGQIGAEQGAWARVDQGPSRLEVSPVVTYEWQDAIESDPEFALGPLLDVFLRQGADWSFARTDPRWVERTDTRAEVFLFSREAIEGRQPEFAARDLLPVFERHHEAAIARTPSRFYVTADLPRFAYDFDTGSIRFLEEGTSMSVQGYSFAESVEPLTPLPQQYYELPQAHRQRVYYTNFYRLEDRPSTQPGGHEISPATSWRMMQQMAGTDTTFPSGLILALDRAAALTSIPVDPARAEQLVQMNAVQGMGGKGLRARIYFEVEEVALTQRAIEPYVASATLVSRLERVEVLGEHDEVISEFPASAFPAP